MILSSQEIKSRSINGGVLVNPFDKDNLRRSSYDLTVGKEFYCGEPIISQSFTASIQQLDNGTTFLIPANGVCFLLCTETITLPDDITAKVALRMPLIYRGLVITAQPPFDPGYSGKVIVMLHNLSSQAVQLTQGERVVSIEFSQVSHPTTQTSPHRRVDSLSGQLRGPWTGSLTEMQARVESARRDVNRMLLQIGTVLALALAVPTVSSWLSYNSISDEITTLEKQIEKMQDVNEELKKANLEQRLQLERIQNKLESKK
jgi:deoxycytidine triphosphate deaminase